MVTTPPLHALLRLARWAAVLAVAALVPPALQAQARSPQPAASSATSAPSEAERLVFLHEHLGPTRQPRVLRYLYVDESAGKPPVSDKAVVILSPDARGRCCNAHADYLSGALAVDLPDIPDARANPVLLYFLESEVRLLQRTTAGQAAHFRRRIRQALADTATVSDTTIRWGTRTLPARTVHLAPFVDDPYRARFQEQAATEYSFVFSDAVPGGIYQASAVVPGPAAGAAPMSRRTLTIEETP
jgi:hypothetical protein